MLSDAIADEQESKNQASMHGLANLRILDTPRVERRSKRPPMSLPSIIAATFSAGACPRLKERVGPASGRETRDALVSI
jgi:hypothetical protein